VSPDVPAIAHKLGSSQRLAVLALHELNTHDQVSTPWEVASRIAWRMRRRDRRPHAEAENMANTLRSLERKGIAERTGKAPSGAGLWRLTAYGRDVYGAIEESVQ
jgi:hypothetical protein